MVRLSQAAVIVSRWHLAAWAGLAGFILGLILGLRSWSPAWPELSALSALRTGALGWLYAVGLAVIIALVLKHRSHARSATSVALSPWRTFILILGFLPGSLWLLWLVPSEHTRKVAAVGRRLGDNRPNLILITLDALRRDHLGVSGGTSPSLTPNLDAFAQQATRYDSAYAVSDWTLASLSALATGLLPSQTGMMTLSPASHKVASFYEQLPEDKTVLSERLRDSGYATVAVVTNVFLEPKLGWTRGFDYFRNEGGVDGDRSGLAIAPTLTGNSAAWLRLNWRQPFFLWIHYLDPHSPYNSPTTPKELRGRYPSQWVARQDDWKRRAKKLTRSEQAQYEQFCRELYAEEVKYVDRWVGRLLAQLKAEGQYENSLIVITADHGEELFEHGGLEHGHSMHEEVLSVPLLVKWPQDVAADRQVTQVVSLLQVTGTLLEAAQAAPLHEGLEPLPKQRSTAQGEVYSEWPLYGPVQTSLVTEPYHLIYHPFNSSGKQFEVYDRRKDRRELHNLADMNLAQAARARLQSLTKAALERISETGHSSRASVRPSMEEQRRLRALGYLGK